MAIKQIWHRIGRRGATLLLLAIIDLALAFSMLTLKPALLYQSYRGHQLMFPIEWWGYLWLGAAIVLAVSAFRRDDRIGFAVAMGVKVLWALGFYVSFFYFNIERAVISAYVWTIIPAWLFLVAGWPEASKDHHVPE